MSQNHLTAEVAGWDAGRLQLFGLGRGRAGAGLAQWEWSVDHADRPGAGRSAVGDRADAGSGQAGVAYDACYHQACDTIANINDMALKGIALPISTPAPLWRPWAAGGFQAWSQPGTRAGAETEGRRLSRGYSCQDECRCGVVQG